MQTSLIEQIKLLNPWLKDPKRLLEENSSYVPRRQESRLFSTAWDSLWTILIGPRQAGKTTLGVHFCRALIKDKRFETLLYLNCDFLDIRQWLLTPLFVAELLKQFELKTPILFIDEVQRLENPGLLLKAIVDLKLPIKLVASGSSQLEMKSKVQESLTGRQFESLVLPFSYTEAIHVKEQFEEFIIFGGYPSIWQSEERSILLSLLYKEYITKDIIEYLRVEKADAMERLITLVAHSSGQLVNYQQLATDCRVSVPTVQNYLRILEQTYVLHKVTPFVGNKRQEITSNPIYYFVDNGFRNQAVRNFLSLENRSDAGLLVKGFVLQEILKWRTYSYSDINIHYWRTKSGAEVDFVVYKDPTRPLPIEVKYRSFSKPTLTRSYRSFIDAYQPKEGVVLTKGFSDEVQVDGCLVRFIPVEQLQKLEVLINGL